ncbi:nitrogenase protein alpha chain [Sporomusaceae bacterium FL31]|nr:nitrogenase protein alpha chain [Sporomusaceae bacterium FL31]GCE32298.1 nitrogenase protein alpha chain [Sporomusaceae bacterium]
MAKVIEQVRYACALGALHSVLAIDRAVPILHAGPGCGQRLSTALSLTNGYQGTGYAGGHSMPCTNSTETEVVFGGEKKLKELITQSLRVMDADLYVVLTGCTSDIVGDDVLEVARSFQKKGHPVVCAQTGGFSGNNFHGHELILDAIIDQYLKPTDERVPGLVNVFSVVPFYDAFWSGNLQAIQKLLTALGLKPNVIFGPAGGVTALNHVPKAQFNLLLSPWVGLNNVKSLEDKFGTPYLHYPILPIGPTETSKFLRTVGEFAGLASEQVETAIKELEKPYDYYIERSADYLLQARAGLPSRFITISDSFYGLGISKFLVNDLGFLPGTQFVMDNIPQRHQSAVKAEFANLSDTIAAPVVFTNDSGVVKETLRETKFKGRPLILGSGWDQVLAKELNGYQLSVTFPVSNRFILNSSYVGYDGALRLAEDVFSVLVNSSY